MRKIFLTVVLSLALTVSAVADGETPISGVQGCAPGLWYPISQICCMPGLECPVERSAPATAVIPESSTSDTMLVKIVLMIKNIF